LAHRFVSGLTWAEAHKGWPKAIPRVRARKGPKGDGIRFERKVAEAASWAKAGQWFEFADVNGRGLCQTDLIYETKGLVLVVECKYTWVPEGHSQIESLYRPVIELATAKPVVGVVLVKVLKPEIRAYGAPVFGDLQRAVDWAVANGGTPVVQWLGQGLLAAPVFNKPAAKAA
jgi:hypothetical protein